MDTSINEIYFYTPDGAEIVKYMPSVPRTGDFVTILSDGRETEYTCASVLWHVKLREDRGHYVKIVLIKR